MTPQAAPLPVSALGFLAARTRVGGQKGLADPVRREGGAQVAGARHKPWRPLLQDARRRHPRRCAGPCSG